ncbi:MAG: Ldh family oxidoreductase [Rhodospirillales bacterium]|jgi:LDH2 family malate/lactate/ureidoglycolate dehydrogenase|nr:Ldh family oxidoreductase [Rhodospirillales bacterium]
MPDAVVAVDPLRRFVTDLFGALGLPPGDAEVQAHCLLEAHFRGFDTHGVGCIPSYAECLVEGRIKARPAIRIERRMPWVALVDGDNGMGHVVASRAMAAAIEAAREIGIGAAAVRRSNHFGAAGVYPAMALDHDCVGIAMGNAAPNVAPWGARQGLLGTNPLAVAVPAGRHPPFVMDMATSTAARRKIRQAMEHGQPIPEGWAIDRDGRPTTDAKAAIEGVALPFGGAKGSAISMLVDILAGVLPGAEFAGTVVSFVNNTGREAGCGAFFMAFKVSAFMPLDTFKARMDTLIDRLHALEPAAGFDAVRVPGERGASLAAERRREGIPLAPGVIDKLGKLGADLGVTFPA